MGERFADDFKRFFLRGLAAGLPAILTVVILVWFFAKLDHFVGRYINVAVKWLSVQALCILTHVPVSFRGPDAQWDTIKNIWATYRLAWVGFVLAFVVIYIFGRFVASMLGRGTWRMIERALFRVPVIRQVYSFVKQVTDYLLSRPKMAYSRVVAVEYPRKGTWSLGLVTGPGMRTVRDSIGGDLLTVFVPSSPTPITGYTITVSRQEVIDLPISIDDALRFTVSGGVIMPMNEQLSRDQIEEATRGIFPPPGHPAHKETSE